MTLQPWREEAIQKKHDRKGFDCGQAELNIFFAKHARQAHESGATKTYVAVDAIDGTTILGFYTLVPTDITFEDAPLQVRPSAGGKHSIGGFRLARLAVSQSVQRQGVGGQLILCVARRCMRVSEEVGGTMIVIDAKDEEAASWYKKYGAIAMLRRPLTLVLPYYVIQKSFAKAKDF